MDEQQFKGDSDRDHSSKETTPTPSCRTHNLVGCSVCEPHDVERDALNFSPRLRVEEYKCKPPTKEEVNRVLNEHRKSCGSTKSVCEARINPKEVESWDKGNPLLENIDTCWENIGKIFKEYLTIESDYIIDYLREKTRRKITLDMSKVYGGAKTIHVDGIPTKIKYSDLTEAYQALTKVGCPHKAAQKLIGRIVEKRISQLF